MTAAVAGDERESLRVFLQQQRAAARNAAYGLTDEQARQTTTGSSLSVGGLIKHLAAAERGWIDKIRGEDESDQSDYAAYLGQFHLDPDETVAGVLAVYDEAAAHTDATIADEADLGRTVSLPKGVPWYPDDPSVRWILLHLIEETARHAGHLDIIRESLDGATAGSLMAAVEGWEPTPWVTPWAPAPA